MDFSGDVRLLRRPTSPSSLLLQQENVLIVRKRHMPRLPSSTHPHDSATHEITARWVVDAAGRASLLKRKLDLAQANDHDANAVWWRVEARDRRSALALLPPYVARRTDVIPVRDIQIP